MVPWMEDGFPVGSCLGLGKTYWAFRKLPNIHFVHYIDLTASLGDEMRRLAVFLRVPLDQHLWPELIAAASFGAMRTRADELAPGAHAGEWRSNANFFRKARLGEWRAVLSAENLALYEALTTKRIEPRLKAWLEGGRVAAGDPRHG
jgi:aryl sulfotransferase